MKRSNLASRLLTVAVAAPLLMLLLFRGTPDQWYLLVVASTAVGAYELSSMTHPSDRISRLAVTLGAMLVSWVVYHHARDARALLSVIIVAPIAGLLLALWRLEDLESAALRGMAAVAAPLYVGGLLACLSLLRRDTGDLGPYYVLLALKLSWLSDTGAYFAGRHLGKHGKKLHPRVSPGKTRIGFLGALVGATASVLIAKAWYLSDVGLGRLLALGLVAGSLGQLGDLLESMLKRSTGIKDSGALIPGHGGILDRVDALLVVSPVLYLYTAWIDAGPG